MPDPKTVHELTPRERQLTEPRRRQWLAGLRAERELQQLLGVIAEGRGLDPSAIALSEDGSLLYLRQETDDAED